MLSENDKNKLERMVREHQFEHALDYLKEKVRQGIRLSKTGAEDYTEICPSRIGGDPDLPPNVAWPLISGDLAGLFGYPATQHGDCEMEAALGILTGEQYNYSEEAAMERITAHLKGDSDKAKQEVCDTLLLLALDSDQEVGFCWWDAGALQFFIRKEDLSAGNFTNTYCSLYSS